MNYWLVKQEPSSYGWNDFVEEGETAWTGIRNYQARNFLKQMKLSDLVVFYQSGRNAEAVGIASVKKEAYQDPSTDDDRWCAVDLKAEAKFENPVPVKKLKEHSDLEEMMLFRQSRLSIMPLRKNEFDVIKNLGKK